MRLQELVKNYGNFTRSEITKLQNDNKILVNGLKQNLSYNIKENDVVTVNGIIYESFEYQYYLYNKPIGLICSNDKELENGIVSKLNLNNRLFTVGRLDKDSHGLMILTNDGKFNHLVLDKDNHVEKEYIVKVKNKIDNDFINNMMKPIPINNKITKECKCVKIDDFTFSIILKEGMYHQIRKMVIYNKNTVIDLYRIRIGNIKITDFNLNIGEYINIPNLKQLI